MEITSRIQRPFISAIASGENVLSAYISFPYIVDGLLSFTQIPLFDPAREISELTQNNGIPVVWFLPDVHAPTPDSPLEGETSDS